MPQDVKPYYCLTWGVLIYKKNNSYEQQFIEYKNYLTIQWSGNGYLTKNVKCVQMSSKYLLKNYCKYFFILLYTIRGMLDFLGSDEAPRQCNEDNLSSAGSG